MQHARSLPGSGLSERGKGGGGGRDGIVGVVFVEFRACAYQLTGRRICALWSDVDPMSRT